MAAVTLQTHLITSGLSGGGLYETGQYIRVIADGPSISAQLWTAATGGSFIATPSGGPNIDGGFNQIVVSSGTFNNAQYCDEEDLVSYSPKVEWPYANYILTPDHPSCAIVVCDLQITSVTPTNETGVGQNDGEIAVTATSSNGTVKFSLTEGFDYGDGQDSPITGLATGNYTVYAKDEAGCTDSQVVFVGQEVNYGARWRMEYDKIFPRGHKGRTDIEELEYVGAVTEVCGGASPFGYEYRPDKNSAVVPSVATIEILCNTDAEFDDIRKGTDRQFRVRHYTDSGAGFELDWTGFISPEFYSEPYLYEPYIVTLEAYDGLGELKNKDFVALSGSEFFGDMSLIKIVAECLKKLPLQLNIRSCVNLRELDMDTTDADDPLAMTFIASQNFRESNCDKVLTSILSPFTGAELFQSKGVWWIRTREQAVYSNLPYREFDVEGDYDSSDSIAARKKLDFGQGRTNRFAFRDRSQVLSYTRNYGRFRIVHDLGKDNNMIDSGGFEDKDLHDGGFRGWSIFPAQVNVSYGQEKVENGSSRGAFFFQWAGTSGNQADNVLASLPLPLPFPDFASFSTRFSIKFKIYVSLAYPVKWVRLGVRLRWTDTDNSHFYDSSLQFDKNVPVTADTENKEDFYITSFNSWQTIEIEGLPCPFPAPTNGTVSLAFFFHNHTGRDFSSFTNLRAATTLNTLKESKRVYATDGGDAPTYGYELRRNTESENAPDIIRPNDYNASSNPMQWVKIDELNIAGGVAMVDRIMIDDVELKIFGVGIIPGQPGIVLIDPPEDTVYESEVSQMNESVFEEEVMNGDAPEILGAKYIYNGFFKLADGTPTALWARDGVSEAAKLLDIYLSHLVAQGSKSLRVLSGNGFADIEIGYINSLEDQRDNRRYRFKRFGIDDRHGNYTVEMEETLTGDDGESPPDAGEFEFTTEFSEEFTA